MADALAQFKQRARATWSNGDWDAVADGIMTAGTALLDRVGVEPGMDVLDVGTGSGGNVAVPAARRGARVVGSDITSRWFDAGRRRAAEAGVEIEWVEADAESLPFEDESFDRVLSTFAHMFAPRHAVTAAELARVCRPGGLIGTTTWLPGGWVEEMFAIGGKYAPGPPPEFVEPPIAWGDQEHVRALYEAHGLEVSFESAELIQEDESFEESNDYFDERFPPIVTMREALGDRWDDARAELRALSARYNEASDGSSRLRFGYLITIARKPG